MSNTLSIFDILERAKQLAPNDLEKQALYVQLGVDLIKKNYPDLIRSSSAKYKEYDVIITMFPSDRMIVSWWQLKLNMQNIANGLEYCDPSTKTSKLVFCSKPFVINQPLLPKLM